MPTQLTFRLLDWYSRHARSLPWRDHPDPYAVWVSEIMLQQTQVAAVIPYFERWMARFPTLESLAESPQEHILQIWEGLGYYSRARNLHRAAQVVVHEHNGQIPAERKLLEKLPGIGRYTAAAIASMAFGRDEAALDGNIRRVLARLFDLRLPARSLEGERQLWALAEAHLPPGRAGDYNQALMDLGATICTPRQPDCEVCPLSDLCQARTLGVQAERPVPVPRRTQPHYTVAAAIIQRDDKVLIAQRPANGLLGGMWEFPGGKLEPGEDLVTALRREIREELDASVTGECHFGEYRHAYTHFKVTLHAFRCRLASESNEPRPVEADGLAWELPAALAEYPMGKIDRQIALQLAQSDENK
jgi:A/G-specific adenine glycosylase